MRLDALCCFISGFIALAPPASAQNLLHNPGFEEVYGGSSLFFPSYWANGSPSAISSSEVARSGEWSAQINSTASLQPGAAQGDGFFPGSVPTIAATPGLEYEFSVYALHLSEDTLAGSGHRVGLTLGFYGADAFSVGSVFELVFDGTTDDAIPAEDIWHRRSVSMVAPENTIGVWLELRIFTDDTNRNNGTAYFDDAALRVVPAPGAAALFGLGALTARRRRSRAMRGTVMALAGLAGAPAMGQNLLLNGGFEDVTPPDHPEPLPYHWFSGPNSYASTLEAHTGEYSMHVTATSSLLTGLRQGDEYIGVPSMPPVIPASPGVAYELGAFLLHRSDDSMHDTGHLVGLAIGFYNADHESVGYLYEPFLGGFSGGPINPLSEDVWHHVSISAVAPDDAIGVWVHLRIDTNDQNRLNGSVFFDDASLRVVPAPGATALFGACAVALRRRR